jgi:flavin reductase (DIM6/NTAB) family NADH-FMN oxidoreductase RutF
MSYRPLEPDRLDRAEAYKLFISAVVPRPIGWVSTCSESGLANAAPFSWFNAVCGDPLMLMFSAGKRRGQPKDTTRNIEALGEYVVNVATAANADKMVQSSADYEPDISEFDAVGLTPLPATRVRPPRIAESPIHFECELEQVLRLGNDASDVIIGRCVMIHIQEEVLAEDGRVDATRLAPIARLGRDEYAVIREVQRIPRPPQPTG